MIDFYTASDTRAIYENELVAAVSETVGDASPRGRAVSFLAAAKADTMLEIGASTGRGYRQLTAAGFTGRYIGIEPSNAIIESNRARFPKGEWLVASAYELPLEDASVPLIYSEYVLEHLVYPHRALAEIVRVLRPGGTALLLFPDFQASGRLGSQMLGLGPLRSPREKLRKGRLLDLLVSLYDSRIRLPKALALACDIAGPFPINIAPRCLRIPTPAYDDYDAVYIASKHEVRAWAEERGLVVSFPAGCEGVFSDQALLAMKKPG